MSQDQDQDKERDGELPEGIAAVRVGPGIPNIKCYVDGMDEPLPTHTVLRPPRFIGTQRTRVPAAVPTKLIEEARERLIGVRIYHHVGTMLVEHVFNGTLAKSRGPGGLAAASTVMFEPEEYGGQGPIVPLALTATSDESMQWRIGRHTSCELQVTDLDSVSEFAAVVTFRRGAFDITCLSRTQRLVMLVESAGGKVWRALQEPTKLARDSLLAFADVQSGERTGIYLRFS